MDKLAMGPEDEMAARGGGGSGPLLAYNRRRRHVDIFQLVNADQHWTFDDVLRLEGQVTVSATDVARYMRALDSAERARS